MEITQQTIILIINGIFAFFIIMGFLFGAARGLKKSALRLTFVVSIAIIMYFAAPLISNWLLGYDFSTLLNGMTVNIGGIEQPITTISELITAFINSNTALQNFVAANPSFIVLINQLPTIVANLVIFLLGFWVLKILTWPIYAISSRKYNKRMEDGSKPKKHGFAGGFMGVVQGAVIALVTFMPIAGVSSMLNVEGGDGTGGTLLGSFIPQEFADLLPSYEDSLMGKIGGIGNIDTKVFDGLTTIKVTDEVTGNTYTFTPRQEVVTGMEIAGDIQALINMVTGIQDGTITEIDWDLVENLVDKVFKLDSLQLLLEQYAPYIVGQAANNAEYGVSEQIDGLPVSTDVRAFIDEFLIGLDEATIDNFKSDIMAIVNIGRALDDHGIVDLLFQMLREEIINDDLAKETLTIFGTNRDLSADIMTAILGSNSIKTLMPEAINIVLGYAEHFINEGKLPDDEYFVPITRIDADTIDWDLEAEFLTDIMYNLLSFTYSIDPFNLGDADEMDIINSLELSKLGEVINTIRSTQLFGGIYSSIIEAVLSMPQVTNAASDYINFDTLINLLNTTDWVNELNTIEQMIDLYILIEENGTLTATQIESVIERLDSDLLELVIDGAMRAIFIEGFGETIGDFDIDDNFVFNAEFAWIDDLDLTAISANAEFFAQVIEFAFSVANSGIEDVTYADIQALVDAVQGVNESDLTVEELAQFKGFFNSILHYALSQADETLTWTENLDIDDLIDNIDTIAELFKLGLAISDETFADYTTQDVDNLIAEIAELDDMSPELIAVLQGFYDDIMATDSPIFVPLDIASIDWAYESDILEDAINLYLTYEDTSTFDGTLAETLVGKLETSYIAGELLNALIGEIVNEETTPDWVASADMTWVSDNAGLLVELADLALWSMDNDISTISQTQIDALQAEVDLISESTQALIDFKAYVQSYVDSITPIV
ncbi:MAG: hypothetical protein PHC46_01890 [Clostridia bacterium]|nr:hypothetical protein [Clostridia bacterium]